ncbi:DUF484 domain-containing protein [Serratia microhaemolytica]|uniref:DUF484 domain-containing protein n=1 Tax=Serratia microhaemolytica TaxID=2675110 RepID=UPI000FDDA772|nr:DUF484 domain-containing protein [Serratia microhaemolytica]
MKEPRDSEMLPASMIDDQCVLQYLQQHPDFFLRQAAQVEQLRVPHVVRGATSLVEWQLARQRHQIAQLQQEISLLMEQATANQQLFTRLLQLQSDISTAESLPQMLMRLQLWAKEFGLVGADIRLFSDRWHLQAPSDFNHLALARSAFEPLRIQRLRDQQHYLGQLNAPELLLLLPQAKQVGSVAISLLGELGDLGVLIFSSRDAQHYQQGMGTLLLSQLAQLLPAQLERWIVRL